MSQPGKVRRRVRPWIVVIAAYAFALELMLAGVAAAQETAAAGDLFVICHSGDGSAGDPDGTGKPPAPSPCALCALAGAPCAILPPAHAGSTIDAQSASDVLRCNDARIARYDAPRRHYPRGPPAFARISG